MKSAKPVLVGLILGYLITSAANIPFPTAGFWQFLCGVIVIGIIITRTYFKVNDDTHPGDF